MGLPHRAACPEGQEGVWEAVLVSVVPLVSPTNLHVIPDHTECFLQDLARGIHSAGTYFPQLVPQLLLCGIHAAAPMSPPQGGFLTTPPPSHLPLSLLHVSL